MKVVLLGLIVATLAGCLSTQKNYSQKDYNQKDYEELSCEEMLNDNHILDANHHGSEHYRELVARYKQNNCPAAEFHETRNYAVDKLNISRLSKEDANLSCYDLLVEKTRVDELFEWTSITGNMVGMDDHIVLKDKKYVAELGIRKRGFESLYRVNNCDDALSDVEKSMAKEVHRAPIRYMRKVYVKGATEAAKRSTFGELRADEQALSCQEIIVQIREEEDNRVYHHGTFSRVISPGGNLATTFFGAVIFGEVGAAVGLLIDAQSYHLAKRMTKREGRLLEQLNEKSCYYDLAVNDEQQADLENLVDSLSTEDKFLSCTVLKQQYQSAMEKEEEKTPYDIFWDGKRSGTLSPRDAGLIVLAEKNGCLTPDDG